MSYPLPPDHDHLDDPAYAALTPDDLLDLVSAEGIGWDSEREMTAIGNTLEEARTLYYDVQRTLDSAVADTRAGG